MESPFGREVTVGSRLPIGKRLMFRVVDGAFRHNVVSYNKNADYPKEIKGREMDKLTTTQLEIIKDAPAPTWPDGSDAPKFEDRYNFVIEEVESGTQLGKVTEDYAIGGLEFTFPGGRPGKDFFDTYRALTGKEPDLDSPIKISEFLDKGTTFTSFVKRDKNGYSVIDKSTIQPVGMISETSTAATPKMSENGKKVLGCLQNYKDQVNGMSMGAAMQKIGGILSGVLTTEEFMASWKEIKGSIVGPDGNVKV